MLQDGSRISTDTTGMTFIRAVLDDAAKVRLPDLFNRVDHRHLYNVHNRSGITTVAVRTCNLAKEEIISIMKYRLAQYIIVGQTDSNVVFDNQLMYEPLENLKPDDVHIIAGSAETGEILCYVVIQGAVIDTFGVKMADPVRPLLPVEQHFGSDVFCRLEGVPGIPVCRVRELGRFVKNQQIKGIKELQFRAPMEVMLAILRVFTGPLVDEVEVAVGDIEMGGSVRAMLDFFCVPIVLIPNIVPKASEDEYLSLHYKTKDCAPFASKCSQIPLARLAAIEEALMLPGRSGMKALVALKSSVYIAESSLDTAQQDLIMDAALSA